MKKIVIVGAGTAGLAAAAMMKSYWGSKVDITLSMIKVEVISL